MGKELIIECISCWTYWPYLFVTHTQCPFEVMIPRSTVLFFILDNDIPLFLLWIGPIKGLPILSIFSKTSFGLWFFSIALFSFVFYWFLFLNSFLLLQFIYSVVSDFLCSRGLQHARVHCPSTTPRPCSNSFPSSQWCHPTISSSVVPSSFCLSVFPNIRIFTSVVSSLHQVAKVLEFQFHHQSFHWIFRIDFL